MSADVSLNTFVGVSLSVRAKLQPTYNGVWLISIISSDYDDIISIIQ
ncbi:hypothetical protein ymoll0001_17180 [Yersinia mollaretii ATCC 43969]|uniref:Uncharacterized protein n=1 Tax=Yersinia mollaretii (strain ATCC 43969 / DSM 18520 / CIP 103324 / CNY 7263 / WAIP 204) TaxID=349967 RepID=A0ABP2E8W5_YERMW|nr:hypothetical protein ymoll0001_17180 [Yersinia mollaretii ATCC 43969]